MPNNWRRPNFSPKSLASPFPPAVERRWRTTIELEVLTGCFSFFIGEKSLTNP